MSLYYFRANKNDTVLHGSVFRTKTDTNPEKKMASVAVNGASPSQNFTLTTPGDYFFKFDIKAGGEFTLSLYRVSGGGR